MQKGDKIGIVCCSDGQKPSNKNKIDQLTDELSSIGLNPVFSQHIYAANGCAAGTAEERAASLMAFYKDKTIKAIFDISGGDLANEILPWLDFDVIADSQKQFWGYSDLTVILNAVYAKTNRTSVLYQIRNLLYDHAAVQKREFKTAIFGENDSLFQFPYEFIQGEKMHGIVAGGNIRCLLKLAGTEYFPDFSGKILFLEAYSGTVPKIRTYLSQLDQLGVLKQASGILLGTFTQMEQEGCQPDAVSLVKNYVNPSIPIAKTSKIGHGTDSKGLIIGSELFLSVPSRP